MPSLGGIVWYYRPRSTGRYYRTSYGLLVPGTKYIHTDCISYRTNITVTCTVWYVLAIQRYICHAEIYRMQVYLQCIGIRIHTYIMFNMKRCSIRSDDRISLFYLSIDFTLCKLCRSPMRFDGKLYTVYQTQWLHHEGAKRRVDGRCHCDVHLRDHVDTEPFGNSTIVGRTMIMKGRIDHPPI
jgi:hypothetical protein